MSACQEKLDSLLESSYEYFLDDSIFELSDDELIEYSSLVSETLEFLESHEDDLSDGHEFHGYHRDLDDILFQITSILEDREDC